MRNFWLLVRLGQPRSHRLVRATNRPRETVFNHAEYLIIMDTATTTSHLIVTEAEFSRLLATAAPGSVLQYHDGFLVLDVAKGSTRLSASDRKQLVAVARLAWSASEHRIVHLVQRRLGPSRFAYLAVVRARPTMHKRRAGAHDER